MKDYELALVKIDSMTSLEIAELTGKTHGNVLRDIKTMVAELKDDSDMNHKEYQGVTMTFDERNYVASAKLDKVHTLTLVTGYSIKARKAIIDRWQFLEDQLNVLKFNQGDKKHQLDAMEALHHLLPDDLQGEALSYIKANVIVNKAVSNLFGFPSMLKKDQMSGDMLEVREKILDDYIKLYEVIEDNSQVKEILYAKYRPKRIENKT
jgi:phage regulator Rha-like protein